ncbi:ATP-binding protein [Halorubrum sp. DTA46]|uniref:ATP-binding protein n=1 Tax=Halorubrum sp. DTA46 TaxID=3402162 RepID=UPI003AAD23F6
MYENVGVPVWFFDLKQDYRHLASRDSDLLVLPWSELKLNPLRPPNGVPPRRWAQVFSEMFGHSTALLSGSKNYLLKSVIKLYRAYNQFEEVSEPFPSLIELQALIEADSMSYMRKSSNYRDTVLNRLEAMNLTAGTVFDCSRGYDLEELLKRDVVFEFDGLSRDVQNFLMEILFAYVFEYRLAQNQRDNGLRHLFFLDEGKRVFSVYKERQNASGLPEIDELTAKMREFGEGLVVGDQEPGKLTDSIKANTYTKVLLPLGDRKQFDEVADSLNLSDRQREYAQGLGTGEAVVQVGNSSPIPVSLDDYSLEKQVSEEDLEQSQADSWTSLSYESRSLTPGFKSIVAPGRSDEVESPEIVQDPQRELDLSGDADQFLKDVVKNPFRGLTDRYSDFPSSYKGNKAKNELVDNGVVVERKVHTEKGKRKLLQLTDKGREYAETELGLEVKHRGRGGVIHRYWQNQIKDLFEDVGWSAFLEKFDADVYVNMGNTELVVEVAMGDNPREIKHVEEHLERFDTVWIACRNQEVREGLRQRLAENSLEDNRVVFRLFREFNKDQPPST